MLSGGGGTTGPRGAVVPVLAGSAAGSGTGRGREHRRRSGFGGSTGGGGSGTAGRAVVSVFWER